jgi:hypothetical protein
MRRRETTVMKELSRERSRFVGDIDDVQWFSYAFGPEAVRGIFPAK